MSAETSRRSRTHAATADDPTLDGPEDEPRRLLSLKATGRVLGGITEPEIRKWVRAGDLELVKIGRRSMISIRSIDRFTEKLLAEAAQNAAAA